MKSLDEKIADQLNFYRTKGGRLAAQDRRLPENKRSVNISVGVEPTNSMFLGY